ncbi:MAG TPA: HlyD family secretion protein [Candidatus Dormibacteraeota bacterium]|jgi:membrane fusion protein (multidrug efflux system)|nr:HlyD family secretion protein [Candidatus Dormibacteraeota bacterium]
MPETTTEAPESPKVDEPKSSGTGVGPGRAPRRLKPRTKILLGGLGLAVIVIVALLYLYFRAFESTDDAQIDGYIYPVSARVTGYVTRVTVDNNQYVEAGTVLAQLDPKDYEVVVANARATLANDQASAAAQKINVPVTSVSTSSSLTTAQADLANATAGLAAAQKQFDAAEAALRQAEANDLNAQDNVKRYKPLAAKDEIPQQQYTQAVLTQRGSAAAVASARASAAATEQSVTQARAKVAQALAEVRNAETRPQQISIQVSRARAAEAQTQSAAATLQQAQLNLQYTTIVAPVSGLVGQRSVQPGQNVSVGQQMMTIVPLDSQNIWVTANFKETQLKHMRPGQSTNISVDTYGRTYTGHVLNIAGATGSLFSILPPENATGNYVKVVQRIPVKIVFEKGQDPEHLLRLGMSVEPKVRVR